MTPDTTYSIPNFRKIEVATASNHAIYTHHYDLQIITHISLFNMPKWLSEADTCRHILITNRLYSIRLIRPVRFE